MTGTQGKHEVTCWKDDGSRYDDGNKAITHNSHCCPLHAKAQVLLDALIAIAEMSSSETGMTEAAIHKEACEAIAEVEGKLEADWDSL